MYRISEISLGNLSRLYRYAQDQAYKVDFSLKGFDYPWLMEHHTWKSGEKVLDVGAAYSPLPIHIQQTYGCEMWVVDDFGTKSGDAFWTRGNSPREHIDSHPEIKYVLERLGDPNESSLLANYFDTIYSISVLEHVPTSLMPAVWHHMDRLLKPGGEMLHAIDVTFPSNGGLKKVLMALAFDAFYSLAPKSLRQNHCLATPKAYARLVLEALGARFPMGKDMNALNMVLNPDILTEAINYGLLRITKDRMLDYRYQRVGTLLLRMRKE